MKLKINFCCHQLQNNSKGSLKKKSKKSDNVTKGTQVGRRPKTTFYLRKKIVTWRVDTKIKFCYEIYGFPEKWFLN